MAATVVLAGSAKMAALVVLRVCSVTAVAVGPAVRPQRVFLLGLVGLVAAAACSSETAEPAD